MPLGASSWFEQDARMITATLSNPAPVLPAVKPLKIGSIVVDPPKLIRTSEEMGEARGNTSTSTGWRFNWRHQVR